MKIVTGEHIGFCLGVQRAVEQVENALERYGSVYTYGDIIHNKAVVDELRERGAVPVDSLDALAAGERIIVRSHGVPAQFYADCEAKGIECLDATCPFVSRIHDAVREHAAQGDTIVIAGKHDHPEVIGINGHCGHAAHIVANEQQAAALGTLGNVFLVAQTTFIPQEYERIQQSLRLHANTLEAMQSICSATCERQAEAQALAKTCDKMVVIGGLHSSNTKKLLQICQKDCEKSYIVESADDVVVENLQHGDIIGVVAGASTPQWLIREVIARMYENDPKAAGSEEEVTQTPAEDNTVEETVTQAPVEDAPKAEEAEAPQPEQAEEPAAQQEEERELTPEESFERDLEKTMVRIRPRQVRTGTVVQIAGDDVFVNIGYKADGVIPQSELSTDPKAVASEMFEVGDEVTVEILKVNDGEGNVLLSKRSVDRRNEEKQAIAELEDGREFNVRVKQAVKGGLLAEYKGARVFIPASHASDRYVENLEELVGQTLAVKAIEVDKSRRRIVASRKQAVIDAAAREKREKLEGLEVGSRIKGTVRRITDFGAFTDIGGIDGLIHVTDLSWGRVKHPSDVVTVGDELELEILAVNPEQERISLGLKQLQPKPWDNIEEKYLVGDIVEGRVDRIAPFGAFVELEPGLFGLVHISQVATRRIEKVEDELRIGDVIAVKVLDINTENRRISLSRRAVLQEDRPQHVDRDAKPAEENIPYDLPPVENASVTLGDFFPKDLLPDEEVVEEAAAEETTEE